MYSVQSRVDELSDVVVVATAPINYGTHELWEGDFITRQLDLSYPWSSGDFADFMEALTTAYDAYREGVDNLNKWNDTDTVANPMDLKVIATAYLRAGESMIDLPSLMEIEWNELMHALSRGGDKAFYLHWGDVDWLKFETTIAGDDPVSPHVVARAMGLEYKNTKYAISTLLGLYGKGIERKWGEVDDVGKVVLEAVRQGVTSPTTIYARITEAGLTPPSKDCIRHRVRATKERLLNGAA